MSDSPAAGDKGAGSTPLKKVVYWLGAIAAATVLVHWILDMSVGQGRWFAIPLLGLLVWQIAQHRSALSFFNPSPTPFQPRPGHPLFWIQGLIFGVLAGLLVELANDPFKYFMAIPWFLFMANSVYARVVSPIFVPTSSREKKAEK